jgi:hypothetical protein
VNHSSLRASPAGSTAAWCHCSSRWVLVKLPFFSVCAAAGRKNTSVLRSSVRISPVSISGPFCHQVALSVSEKSRITSQSRFARPSRCMRALAEPTAGFWPSSMYPVHTPSSWARTVSKVLWLPVSRGR